MQFYCFRERSHREINTERTRGFDGGKPCSSAPRGGAIPARGRSRYTSPGPAKGNVADVRSRRGHWGHRNLTAPEQASEAHVRNKQQLASHYLTLTVCVYFARQTLYSGMCGSCWPFSLAISVLIQWPLPLQRWPERKAKKTRRMGLCTHVPTHPSLNRSFWKLISAS